MPASLWPQKTKGHRKEAIKLIECHQRGGSTLSLLLLFFLLFNLFRFRPFFSRSPSPRSRPALPVSHSFLCRFFLLLSSSSTPSLFISSLPRWSFHLLYSPPIPSAILYRFFLLFFLLLLCILPLKHHSVPFLPLRHLLIHLLLLHLLFFRILPLLFPLSSSVISR